MAKQTWNDPIIGAVIDLLKKKMSKDLVKHYYDGDVLLVQRSMLPVISVARDNLSVIASDSTHDTSTHVLTISVITDIVDYSGLKNWNIMAGQNMLYRIINGMELDEKKPEINAKYLKDSLAYILTDRKNQELGNGIFLNIDNASLSFDFGIGNQRRGQGIFSTEATCQIAVVVDTDAINPFGTTDNPVRTW